MERTCALVTGASSGIGEEYCRELASRCDRIIAVARRGDRLEQLAQALQGQCEVVPVVADLGTVEGVARTIEALRQQGPVSYLVNNAGFSTLGPFARSDIEDELAMIRVHVDASVQLCRAALPFMLEAGQGFVINVASIGGLLPMRNTAVYGACKAFLNSFSASLQEEVAGKGILVQCLCPGFTHTEIHHTEHFAGFDKTRFPEEMWMTVEEVVAISLQALDTPDLPQVPLVPGEMNVGVVRNALQQQVDSIRSIQ
ncbi:SDR family NAD(P)-dependent oxidoreductase [Parahaliea maris]|uniref:SDR family NAD(P)-dependent oxidoreductase n=1 Tax=Parahaliea maris TaxID=2716870 RepID=A0A5C8ZW86_9GAMM|nr:SDR family NAD(P)-dependent oxidoreductase [Parahaliea maris]TXS92109.1 SDR family NAD(P)-dependent oxidoreductase [Parahaliea maris]